MTKRTLGLTTLCILMGLGSTTFQAHGVSGKDAVFLQGLDGSAIGPLMYLGATHTITGYDRHFLGPV